MAPPEVSSSAAQPAFQFANLPILPKLAVSEPRDALEIEADQVADRVMRMAAPTPATPGPAASPERATLQRKCAACEEENKLQRKPGGAPSGATAAPPIVHDVLRSPGQPLDAATRAYMEPRFGHDFSRVRLHTDAQAAASARAVGALAYTVGRDIVFSEGRHAPSSGEGRRLLAHAVQQASGVTPHLAREAAPAPPAPAPPGGGLSDEMLEQIARDLHQAMEGWGTDEEAIYAALGGRTTDQVDAIAAKYAAMYPGHTLIADLRDELSDSEMHRLEALAPRLPRGTAEPASEGTFRAMGVIHERGQVTGQARSSGPSPARRRAASRRRCAR